MLGQRRLPPADGALANLWVSFAASDHTADPWTVLYKVLGSKVTAEPPGEL